MSLYLDASVLVATVVDEGATQSVQAFISMANEPLVVSEFAAVEVTSALSRLVRTKLLTARKARSLLREFDAWRSATTTNIDCAPSDFVQARLFVADFDLALRGPDALHAAICRRADYRLVTLDRRLSIAAGALGIAVDYLG